MHPLQGQTSMKQDRVRRLVLSGREDTSDAMSAKCSVTLKEGRDPEGTGNRDVVADGDQERWVRDVQARGCGGRLLGREGRVADADTALEVQVVEQRSKGVAEER